MSLRKKINKLIGPTGYELVKWRPGKLGRDAFTDIGRLFDKEAALTVFDVGAHHGQTALNFGGRFPKATIYSFEPFPESYEVLQSKCAGHKNIQIYDFGFSDRNCVRELHSNLASATNSLLSTDSEGANTWGENLLDTKDKLELSFKTVDSFIEESGILKIDILKLDVQGAEYLVLEGALGALKNELIDVVYTEVITQPTYVGQKRFDEVLRFFYDLGFDLLFIYDLDSKIGGKLRQVDVVFTRKGWTNKFV